MMPRTKIFRNLGARLHLAAADFRAFVVEMLLPWMSAALLGTLVWGLSIAALVALTSCRGNPPRPTPPSPASCLQLIASTCHHHANCGGLGFDDATYAECSRVLGSMMPGGLCVDVEAEGPVEQCASTIAACDKTQAQRDAACSGVTLKPRSRQ